MWVKLSVEIHFTTRWVEEKISVSVSANSGLIMRRVDFIEQSRPSGFWDSGFHFQRAMDTLLYCIGYFCFFHFWGLQLFEFYPHKLLIRTKEEYIRFRWVVNWFKKKIIIIEKPFELFHIFLSYINFKNLIIKLHWMFLLYLTCL